MTPETINKTQLLERIHQEWQKLTAYVQTLTPEQLTVPKNAVGWTAKDHLAHLTAWESGMAALLQKQPRWEAMGVDQATWETGDFDRINEMIWRQQRDKPMDEVMTVLTNTHERLVEQLQSLSDEDLQRPYRYYQPTSTTERPVVEAIAGDTYEHYGEHLSWIEAAVRNQG